MKIQFTELLKRFKPNSIRTDLTMWYLIIVAVLLVTFSFSMYSYLERQLVQSIDSQLLSNCQVLKRYDPSLHLNQKEVIEKALKKLFRIQNPINHEVRVIGSTGQIFYTTQDTLMIPVADQLAKDRAKTGIPSFQTFTSPQKVQYRVIHYPIMKHGFFQDLFLQLVIPLTPLESTLRHLRWFIFLGVPLSLLIVSLGGIFLAGRVLNPIRQIANQAKTISVHNLNQHIQVSSSDKEIQDLTNTFNNVFSRLYKSFTSISQFSSDVSHELKTPLTIIRGQTELALRKERPSSEYKEVLQSNLEEIQNLTHIIEQLSLLSKLDRDMDIPNTEEIVLAQLIKRVVEQLTPLANEKNIKITVHEPFQLKIKAESLMMQLVFVNLISNSIKYTHPNDTIIIESFVKDHVTGVRVIDHGAGIDPVDIDKIFQRFYRADSSRSKDTGGSGLGLNIVKSIINRYGGEITASSVANEQTIFQIILW